MDYIKYIPEEMNQITEYKELNKASNTTITSAKNNLIQLLDNHFLSSLDEYGCTRMEKIMDIKNSDGMTVEARRLVIISKANNTLPYTIYNLKSKIKALLGNDAFELVMVYADYHLTIRVFKVNEDKMNYIKENIDSMIPCNILYEIVIYYNKYSFFKSFKYKDLKKYTYNYMKEHYFG